MPLPHKMITFAPSGKVPGRGVGERFSLTLRSKNNLKNPPKKILLSLFAAMTCMAASATEVTFDATTLYDESAYSSASSWTLTSEGVTLTCTSGMTNGSQYRIYKGYTLTVTCASNITDVEFTCAASGTSSYGPGNFTADTGTYTYSGKVGTWSGSSTEIVFTASGAQVRCTQIVVTYEDGTTTTAKPTFSVSAGTYFEAISVEIACTTDGATIHYSTDGENYSTYSSAIAISETTTLYAYATSESADTSAVASATYTITIPTNVANIAEALTYVSSNTVVKFTNTVTAVYQSGYYTYVKDDTGWMLIYGTITSYSNGDVIPAGFYGKMTTYSGLYEMTTTVATSTYSSDSFEASTTNVGTVSPTTTTIDAITTSNQNEYIALYNVTLDSSALTLTDSSGNSVAIYKRFITTPDSGTYDIEGFVSVYGTTLQILLTAYSEATGVTDIAGDNRTLVGETLYTTSGAQVTEPTDGSKAIYIVVKTYDDGTSQAVKEIR